MLAAPSEPISRAVAGSAVVNVASKNGRTAVTDLFQQAPLRVMLPDDGDSEATTVVVANISGGVVAGDVLSTRLVAGDEARAILTTPS